MAATVAQLGARVLRKLGVAIVADASRPGAGATTDASTIAISVLRELGVVIPEAMRQPSGVTVAASELAARTLRNVGIDPNNDTGAALTPTLTSVALAASVLRNLGVNPYAAGLEGAHTTVYARTEVAQRALRAMGVNLYAEGTGGAHATVVTATDMAQRVLRNMGVNPATIQSLAGTVTYTQTQIAVQAIIKLGLYSTLETVSGSPPASYTNDLALANAKVQSVHDILQAADIATWAISAIPSTASEYYAMLTAHFLALEFGKPTTQAAYDSAFNALAIQALSGAAGQALATAKLTTVHEMLAAMDIVTWSISAVPAAAAEHYVQLATYQLGMAYGKTMDATVYDAALGRLRNLALAGVNGEAIAEAKVVSVHERLTAQNLATWTVDTIPAAVIDDYVTMVVAVLGSAYLTAAEKASYTSAQAKQIEDTEFGAAQNRIRLIALSGENGQALALAKIVDVHGTMAGLDYVTWTVDTVPVAVAEYYIAMAATLLAPVYGSTTDSAIYDASKNGVRMVALSGVNGQSLALAKINAVHDSLTAAGLTSWNVYSIPQSFAEDYVAMATVLLAPVMDHKADPAMYEQAQARIRNAGIIVTAQARATAQVQQVHEELNALSLVTWTNATIPASLAEAYQEMAVSALGPEFGKDFDQKAYAAAENRVRNVAMGGAAGQALAQQKVIAVHADQDARGRTRWSLQTLPDYIEEPYVFLAAVLLGPEVGRPVDPHWGQAAEMAISRVISVPASREPVQACYF